jgi:hypothetical protein
MPEYKEVVTHVHTKSVPTAAALAVLTGITPRRFHQRDGTAVFVFPPDAEPPFRQLQRAKLILERLVQRDRREGAA